MIDQCTKASTLVRDQVKSGDQPPRPSRARYWVIVFAVALAVLSYIDRVAISQAAGPISRDLSLSKSAMGLVFGAFGLSYSLFEVPTGWLGDWIGARKVLMRVVLWWSAFTALTGAAWNFASLWRIRLLSEHHENVQRLAPAFRARHRSGNHVGFSPMGRSLHPASCDLRVSSYDLAGRIRRLRRSRPRLDRCLRPLVPRSPRRSPRGQRGRTSPPQRSQRTRRASCRRPLAPPDRPSISLASLDAILHSLFRLVFLRHLAPDLSPGVPPSDSRIRRETGHLPFTLRRLRLPRLGIPHIAFSPSAPRHRHRRNDLRRSFDRRHSRHLDSPLRHARHGRRQLRKRPRGPRILARLHERRRPVLGNGFRIDEHDGESCRFRCALVRRIPARSQS